MLESVSSSSLDQEGRGYPRPQLRRDRWYSANGAWDFAFDPDAKWRTPAEVAWSGHIRVPFAPESPASGIGHTGFFRACWYRRVLTLPQATPQERWLLQFGAVDYAATVWVNGVWVGSHEGGYTPFTIDITALASATDVELVVRAEDDPLDLGKPRGKQDWQLEPHSIWYPRTTGIWQSVWLERVPATRILRMALTPNLARWEIGVEAWIDCQGRDALRLGVKMSSRGQTLAADTYQVIVLEGDRHADQPLMLTEFGGIALAARDGTSWGYAVSKDAAEFARQYARLLDVVRTLGLLSGFCYTQFADTYQEANGLLYADRTPKIPLEQLKAATAGAAAARADGLEQIESHAEGGEAG